MNWPLATTASRWQFWRGRAAAPSPSVDPETGLQCLAALRAAAETELARAARFARPVTLLAVQAPPASASRQDVQHFADSLRRHTRGFDLLGRDLDGGFVLVLPEAGRRDADTVALRIQQQSRALLPPAAGTEALRVGLAIFPDDGMLLDELLSAARAHLRRPAALDSLAAHSSSAAGTPAALTRFVWSVGLAGICVLVAAVPWLLSADLLLAILPFVVLGVIAERLTNLRHSGTSESLSTTAIMAAGALGGPAAGAVTGCITGLADWRFNAKPLNKGLFNVGNLTLAGAASGLPYVWLGGASLDASPVILLPGLVAGLLCFMTNTVLLAKVIALASGSSFAREWRLRCNWLAVHYAVMGAISLGVALLYQSYGLTGLLLLLGPIALLHYAQRQYVTHTAAHVAELSSLNRELTDNNRQLITMNERLSDTLDDLRQANESMLTALCEALELRDQETEGHSQRVVRYARALALTLGLGPDEVQAVVHGAHLHDIGKIGVADAILRKPGPLTPDEWVEMKRHPELGYQMIQHIPFLAPAAVLVRYHHEHWNGRGYPAGLVGTGIPIGARIFAVVDSFDAMTSDRPYRKAMPVEAALAELQRHSGSQYDPDIVAVFCGLVRDGALPVEAEAAAEARPPVIVRTLTLTTAQSLS